MATRDTTDTGSMEHVSGLPAMTVLPAAPGLPDRGLGPTLALIGAIAFTGAVGLVLPSATWLALLIYVVGSLALLFWRAVCCGEGERIYVAGPGLRTSLLWGGGIGLALAAAGLVGMAPIGAEPGAGGDGAAPMTGMADLLLGHGLVVLLPLLVLAEEGLWRGLLLSALLERGRGPVAAIALSTLGYALIHLAVAPVGWNERAMMTAMAVPLGLITGLLTLRTRNLWGAVLLHLLVMGSMVAMLR